VLSLCVCCGPAPWSRVVCLAPAVGLWSRGVCVTSPCPVMRNDLGKIAPSHITFYVKKKKKAYISVEKKNTECEIQADTQRNLGRFLGVTLLTCIVTLTADIASLTFRVTRPIGRGLLTQAVTVGDLGKCVCVCVLKHYRSSVRTAQ
jgi:hypothetical protein